MVNGVFIKSSREIERDKILQRIEELEKDERNNAQELIELWRRYKKSGKSYTSPDEELANKKIKLLRKFV